MAAGCNKLPSWFFTFVSFFLLVSVSRCSSQCVDGTYNHEGRTCCLCGVGWHLEEHCTANLTAAKCKSCETGSSYSSFPNNQPFCDPCTSCSHPNENLEEAEPCKVSTDRKCRCKKDHYCVSQTDICRLCQPCKKCGDEGIKVPCTGNSNTVCNEEIKGGNDAGKIAGIIVGVLLIIVLVGVAVGVFFWKWRRPKRETDLGYGDPADDVNLPLNDVDPHLHDIAEVVGWKDMKHIAMRSGIPTATIDACHMNYPNDTEEQTLQLLKIWVEKEGRDAPKDLICTLRRINRRSTAEKVRKMLSPGSQNPPV